MCCCFELKSSEKQRKELQLLIRSFLPQFCQVTVSFLLLPGVSFLYCWLLIDFPEAFFPASVPLCSSIFNVDPGTLFCLSLEASRQPQSRECCIFLLLPSPQDSFRSWSIFGDAPQLRKGSILFHIFSCFEPSPCQSPGWHPAFLSSWQGIFLSLHLFLFHSHKTQLGFESDNSIHMSNQGR